jgi:hypothetical protein
MKRPVKLALWLVGTPIVLLLLLLFVGLFFINGAARRGVEAGGTYALGVNTSLDRLSIGLLSGKLSMGGLRVANPQGFKSDKFMSLGEGDVAVSLASLTKDTIVVPTFALDTIDVNLEKQGGKSNYQVILDNLQKLSAGKPGENKPAPKQEGPGKKLVINDLTIRNVTIHADLVDAPGAVGKLTNVTVPISEIKLTNVGKDTGSGVGGSGVTVGQLSSIIVQAVLKAAAEKGGDVLGPIGGELKGAISQLGDLDRVGVQVVGKAGEAAQQVGKAAGDVEKKVEGTVDKLKGLLPGDKKK